MTPSNPLIFRTDGLSRGDCPPRSSDLFRCDAAMLQATALAQGIRLDADETADEREPCRPAAVEAGVEPLGLADDPPVGGAQGAGDGSTVEGEFREV